jgi:tRNA-specific 2-thiouridylase
MMRVLMAMSGGVDSAVAAALLVEQGHEVIGMTMQLWDYGARRSLHAGRCCASEDIEDARRVAHHLGIPFYAINFQKEFKEQVVQPFIDDYISGRTPIPCVNCNSGLKFSELVRVADRLGATHVATGHYARLNVNPETRRREIWKARDQRKDQSYFLFNLSQDQLCRAMFPLSDFAKREVREMARERRLPVAEKPESQELCFLQGESPGAFIQRHIPDLALGGQMTDTAGNRIGEHNGIQNFTIGQRRGLGIAAGEPRYVVEIDSQNRTVRVGTGEELMSRAMHVNRVNWLSIEAPASDVEASVRIRYKHEESRAIVIPSHGSCRVEFAEPQRAITPGQAAVFYDGQRLLGGGWIDSVASTEKLPEKTSANPTPGGC